MDINRKLFFATLAALILYVAFTLPVLLKSSSFGSENYVSINGKKYTEKDLKSSGNGSFKSVRKDYINKLSQVFDSFAEEEILKMEAAKEKLSVEEFVKSKTGQSQPSEQEIGTIYEMYKDRLGGKSIDEVRGDIVNFLNAQKEDQFKNSLREKYKVEVSTEKPERQEVATKDNPSLGPENAKVTIIEFSDFECPFCKRSQDTTRALREKYKDKIRWVFRDYPLPFHQNAMFAHIAANCSAKQGKYWDYFNILFDNSGNLPRENVISLAKQSGLDMGAFNECVEDKDGKIAQEIQMDIQDGQKVGVNGTPAFFINGIMVEGAQPIQNFERIIDKELQ
ncbi:MAG: DsbA family protein [Leptospiraceae bacterium]|nr:DsbA family protein [Leptospiraceae bacterium]